MIDWQFYVAIAGVVGGGIVIYLWGKKIGPRNLNWKHYAVVFLIFGFPTIILPMWFSSLYSLTEKILTTLVLIAVVAARYASTTKLEHDVTKFVQEKRQKQDGKNIK